MTKNNTVDKNLRKNQDGSVSYEEFDQAIKTLLNTPPRKKRKERK